MYLSLLDVAANLVFALSRRSLSFPQAKSIEPTTEAEADWVKLVTSPTFMTEYQNAWTPVYNMLEDWREKGDFEGLIVK